MLSISLINILFTVINILILLFFVKKFLFEKIDEIIKKRQEEVDEATVAADKATAEARAIKKEYEKKIELADEEKEQILSDIKKLGYEEYERIVMDARKTGDKIVKEARQNARAEAEKERELHADELKDITKAYYWTRNRETDKDYNSYKARIVRMTDYGMYFENAPRCQGLMLHGVIYR